MLEYSIFNELPRNYIRIVKYCTYLGTSYMNKNKNKIKIVQKDFHVNLCILK